MKHAMKRANAIALINTKDKRDKGGIDEISVEILTDDLKISSLIHRLEKAIDRNWKITAHAKRLERNGTIGNIIIFSLESPDADKERL
ncbi:MAG: hypothetical protein WC678_04495 [Parcubacteria group bacterium]|jgi:hypothetical protein